MRLDQFLSARTMYSRRELRQMIQKGSTAGSPHGLPERTGDLR